MKVPIRLLTVMLMAGAMILAGLGSIGVAAQDADGTGGSAPVLLSADGGSGEQLPASSDTADTDVTELPSTGRGSVMTAAETHQLVTEQIVQTIMVLAAVVSVAFASLALYARQKDL